MKPRSIVLGSFFLVGGLATVRWVTSGQKGMPPPNQYLASATLFTMLYGLAGFMPTMAATLALGIDILLLTSPIAKKSNITPLEQAAGLLDRLVGGPAQGSAPSGPSASQPGAQPPPASGGVLCGGVYQHGPGVCLGGRWIPLPF